MMEYAKRIGFRLGVIVSESGKTQREFARLIGISQANLNRVLRGNGVTFKSLNDIAERFKVPLEYFFVEDDREAEYILHPEKRIQEENEQNFLVNEFKNAFQNEQEKNRRLKEELAKKDEIISEQSAKDEIPLNVKELAKALLKATETLIEAL